MAAFVAAAFFTAASFSATGATANPFGAFSSPFFATPEMSDNGNVTREPAPAANPPASNPQTLNPWDAGTTVIAPDGRDLTPAAGPLIMLGLADKRATLEAIRFALTEVADGATFVWRRPAGPLHGIVRPTSSFRDGDGKICRHIVLGVAVGPVRRKVEGIACRAIDGLWSLSG